MPGADNGGVGTGGANGYNLGIAIAYFSGRMFDYGG